MIIIYYFFQHSQFLDAIRRPYSCSKSEFEPKSHESDSSSQSSEEKSLTQIASSNTEKSAKTEATTVDKLNPSYSLSSSMTHNSRSPLKSFASLLQKKLGKKLSPKKDTESFLETARLSASPKQTITSPKGQYIFKQKSQFINGVKCAFSKKRNRFR